MKWLYYEFSFFRWKSKIEWNGSEQLLWDSLLLATHRDSWSILLVPIFEPLLIFLPTTYTTSVKNLAVLFLCAETDTIIIGRTTLN